MTRRGQEKYRFVEILHLQVESSNDGKWGFQACTACLQPLQQSRVFKFHFSFGTSRGAPQLPNIIVLSLEGVRRCPSTGVSDFSDWPVRPQGKLAIHLQIPQLKFTVNFISSEGALHPFIRLTLHVWPTYHLRLWPFRRVRMMPASMTQT